MNPRELLQAAKLNEAIQALGAELRSHPNDATRRTFLFELLCFAGEFDRADKHLELLASAGPDHRTGALLYHAALQAERTRQGMFERKEYPEAPAGEPAPLAGTANGKAFSELEDDDPRIGSRLEVIAGDSYLWIPFEHITSIDVEPPKRLRDLFWANATIETGPSFHGQNLGKVLLPVLSPLSWRHADDEVRLGRKTLWEESAEGEGAPFGQKILLVDGEELPLLELRRLEFQKARSAGEDDGGD